jgi:hypothetical protein
VPHNELVAWMQLNSSAARRPIEDIERVFRPCARLPQPEPADPLLIARRLASIAFAAAVTCNVTTAHAALTFSVSVCLDRLQEATIEKDDKASPPAPPVAGQVGSVFPPLASPCRLT